MELFPKVEPFHKDFLKVSKLHTLYFEEVGNPKGKPVVFLHGGPGGGLSETYRQFFDPEFYRIILFDQRGCGQSTPHAELRENTTWDLVEDIETLRVHLGVEKWLIFGGSWGSTLALCYAIKHPNSVVGLILRGIFLVRKKEIQWFYQEGASKIFPDVWEKYLEPIPENKRQDLVRAYYESLISDDLPKRLAAARAWSTWEAATSHLEIEEEAIEEFEQEEFALAFARIECHYFYHNAWIPTDEWILEEASSVLRDIPTSIVHGRYDVVCPVENAWELKKALPHAELRISPKAGHAALEPETRESLLEFTEKAKSWF